MVTGWTCPQCGQLGDRGISRYRVGILNAHSRRFDPRCAGCGSGVTFHSSPEGVQSRPSGPVLVISGTCASGKTTLSYLLSEHYGFVLIDGDSILGNRKAVEGRNVDFNEIHPYLLEMTEGLVKLGKPVVLAHIVLPEVVPQYQAWFNDRHIDHRIVILMPQIPVLLDRNTSRVCWPKTTPEVWVRKFYEDYLAAPDDVRAFFYENSHETPMETATSLYEMVARAVMNA